MSQDRADKYAGITNEERPLVGVRGEQKDLKRVVRLMKRCGDVGRGKRESRVHGHLHEVLAGSLQAAQARAMCA